MLELINNIQENAILSLINKSVSIAEGSKFGFIVDNKSDCDLQQISILIRSITLHSVLSDKQKNNLINIYNRIK